MWRIGVLAGTGTALKRTIPALLGSEVCRVTVVQGRDADRLKRVADLDPQIRLTTSEAEFAELSSEYDVIFIGSPPFLHLQHLELAARLGLPVICEKPLIANRDEWPRLLELVDDGRMKLMVAHQLRHQQAVEDIAGLLSGPELGAPVAVDMQWGFMMNLRAPSARWKLDPRLAGSNAMFDCGVHAVDLAVRFFGVPERIGAGGYRVRSENTDDTVAALLLYPDFSLNIVASQSGSSAANDLRITFGDAVLRAENLFTEQAVSNLTIVGGPAARTLSYGPVNLYRLEVENFCRSLDAAGDDSTAASAGTADALDVTRILFAVEDAVRDGGLIELGPA